MSRASELFSTVPLFRELDGPDIDRIADAARLETFAAGENIMDIGEPGKSLYVIITGTVAVVYPARDSEFELARLGPGEFFGEMALLNDMPRSATVRTVTAVEALTLAKREFRALVSAAPQLALKLLETMSVRIRNADEQISGLSDKAVRDPLTGLLNRRAFNERLNEEVDRTRRYGEPFSLVLLDLDRFKGINDTLGHDAGDMVLGWIGRILTEHTRAADVPFRIGGEEFAVLCPSTPSPVAFEAARRLVEVVGEARPPVGRNVRITISASFASCPEHGDSLSRLFSIADRGLLAAKREGRDRVARPDEAPVPE